MPIPSYQPSAVSFAGLNLAHWQWRETKSSRKEAQDLEESEKCHWEEAVQVRTPPWTARTGCSGRPEAGLGENRTPAFREEAAWCTLPAVWEPKIEVPAKVWKLFSIACSNMKYRARWSPLRSSGGSVESPGDDVLKERKLRYRRQCLLFAVCILCRPVSPGPTQDVGRTSAQYLSIESAHRKVRLADALTPSEEHHDNPARRVRVRP
jgi:hypothetical protein